MRHEHQLAQHRATRQRLDVAMAKAQECWDKKWMKIATLAYQNESPLLP